MSNRIAYFRLKHRLPASQSMETLATFMRCYRGQTIYGPEDPPEYWYCVVSGMARKSMLLVDGRRRIVDFLLPGDFFGFSAREEHHFEVEAVTEDTVVARYPETARGDARRMRSQCRTVHPASGVRVNIATGSTHWHPWTGDGY